MPKLFGIALEEISEEVKHEVSLESIREDIHLCNNVKDRLKDVKSNIYTRHNYNVNIPYINSILLKYGKNPLRISNEDDLVEVKNKVDEAETSVNEVSSDLETKEKEMVLVEQEKDIQSKQEEEKVEVEPIKKYPLNEKTLTTYAITSPNLLSATAAAIKVGDTKEDAPTLVSTAKTVIENSANNENMVNIIQEGYDYSKTLPQNVMDFYNSPKGKKWLMSSKGQEWISYIAGKYNISKEEDMVDTTKVEEPDFKDIEQPDDVIVAMENRLAEANYIVNERKNPEDIDDEYEEAEEAMNRQTEQTEEVLSDNADKITRLENTMDLVAAGINSVDHIQSSTSITVESAAVYNSVLQKLAIDSASIVNHEVHLSYSISKEDMSYDPAGSLSISREQLVESLLAIYEMIKQLILKAVKALKDIIYIASTGAKMVAGRAMYLTTVIKNKKELTKDKFDTIQNDLLEKYRSLLYILDYNLGNGVDYLNGLTNNPINNIITQPLKDVYGYLNRLNSDIKTDKEQSVGQDLDKILDTMHPDNIINRVFKLKNKYVDKLDKVSKADSDNNKNTNPIYTLFVSGTKDYGLTYTSTKTNNGKEIYKYDIVRLKHESISGLFSTPPTKRDIESILNFLRSVGGNITKSYKQSDNIISYSKSFIEAFKKFGTSSEIDSINVSEISSVISSIVSYAKTISLKYATLELYNYTRNGKALLDICNKCINVMD